MTSHAHAVIVTLNDRLALDDVSIPARVVARAFAADADVDITSWAHELVEETLVTLILKHRGATRVRTGGSGNGSHPVAQFQAAANAAETGDLVPLASFALLESRHIAADGSFKALRDFTAKDLSNLGARYQATAERHAVVSMFYRSLGYRLTTPQPIDKVAQHLMKSIAYSFSAHDMRTSVEVGASAPMLVTVENRDDGQSQWTVTLQWETKTPKMIRFEK